MNMLPEQSLHAIDKAGRYILENIGIKVLGDAALEWLNQTPCQIDAARATVRFPAEVLDQAVSRAASRFTLFSRDGKNDLAMGSGSVYFGNGGRVFQVLDSDTGTYRPTVLKDVALAAGIVDNLENIRFYIIACQAHDVESSSYHVNDFFHALSYTTKHVMGGCDTLEGLKQVWDLVCHLAGGPDRFQEKPFISIITNPVSPLTVDGDTLQRLQFCAVNGIPVTFAPAPIAGVTAPVSLAGTLAQMHAEALAGVALVQCFAPGAKVLYGAVPTAMDMRSMNIITGSGETFLMNAAAVQLAKLYNLPIYASAGLTESKAPDIQGAIEKSLGCLAVGLAGGDYIHLAAGLLDSGNTISYEQYFIDDEIVGTIHRMLRGIEVSPETLALPTIEAVGPGGNYITEDHTIEYMLQEYRYPSLAIRTNFDQWEAGNRPTLYERAARQFQEAKDRFAPVMEPHRAAEIKKAFPGIADL